MHTHSRLKYASETIFIISDDNFLEIKVYLPRVVGKLGLPFVVGKLGLPFVVGKLGLPVCWTVPPPVFRTSLPLDPLEKDIPPITMVPLITNVLWLLSTTTTSVSSSSSKVSSSGE